MTRLTIIWLTGLGSCLALAGCLHPAGSSGIDCCDSAGTPIGSLAGVPRGQIEADLEKLPATLPPPPAESDVVYRALSAEECQCLAVRNADMANMLERERQAVAAQADKRLLACLCKKPKPADVKQSILANTALEIRNRSAAAALEAYYRLAEAEAKSDLMKQSLKRMSGVLEKTQDMQNKGLKLPIEFETLVRQNLDLQSKRVQLVQAIDQLNGELIRLLGLEGCPDGQRLWPTANFAINADPVDVEAAVECGLTHRPELILLRELIDQLDARTLSAVRQLTQSMNGLLGMADKMPHFPVLATLCSALPCQAGEGSELEMRRRQLQDQLAQRERAVAQEIRQAARLVASQTELATLARQQTRSWLSKVQDLEEKSGQGLASFADVAQAEMEYFRARGQLFKEVMAWHIAHVKLKQAQGILPQECDGDCPAGDAPPASKALCSE